MIVDFTYVMADFLRIYVVVDLLAKIGLLIRINNSETGTVIKI